MKTKECNTCKMNRPVSYFSKASRERDGLQYTCKACTKEYHAKYYLLNKEEINENNKEWYYENHEKRNKSIRKYQKERSKTDPVYKLTRNLRTRTNKALKAKKWHKGSSFSEYIGCTRDFFGKHIESQFLSGMSWDNHGDKDGQWSLDHIIPLSSAKTVEELYKLCHYSNIRPLWHIDNLLKSDRLEEIYGTNLQG